MQNDTEDEDRSIDGLCVFPTCENPQTDHLRLPVCEHHIIKTYRLTSMMLRDALPKTGTGAKMSRVESPKRKGMVYFLRLGHLIKIGYTTNLERRLRELPHETVMLTMPGSMRDEKAIHAKFEHLRQTGEWFRATHELTSYIKGLAA